MSNATKTVHTENIDGSEFVLQTPNGLDRLGESEAERVGLELMAVTEDVPIQSPGFKSTLAGFSLYEGSATVREEIVPKEAVAIAVIGKPAYQGKDSSGFPVTATVEVGFYKYKL